MILRLKRVNFKSKHPININEVDIDKSVNSDAVLYSKKGFSTLLDIKMKNC